MRKQRPKKRLMSPGLDSNGVCETTGKHQYSKNAAAKRASYMRRTMDGVLREYKCEYCSSWHIGNSMRSVYTRN